MDKDFRKGTIHNQRNKINSFGKPAVFYNKILLDGILAQANIYSILNAGKRAKTAKFLKVHFNVL